MTMKVKSILNFFLWYAPYLLFEILKSGISVASMILFSKEPNKSSDKSSDKNLVYKNKIIKIDTTVDKKIKKILYACSITLTPGTFTIDVRGNSLFIHALSYTTEENRLDIEKDLKSMENNIKTI